MSAVAAMLGQRLHLQHGPIDLIVSADGDAGEVRAAYAQAREAFGSVLQDLVDELPVLRRDARRLRSSPRRRGSISRQDRALGVCGDMDARLRGHDDAIVSGPVARRMVAATSVHDAFITPMAAVAGSVADHILAALRDGLGLRRASVNNGGDIALWLAPGERYRIGVCTDPATGAHGAQVTIRAEDGIGGVATSGWRGRSDSLGIADAVTVLARTAAQADAAATLIANAVDLPGSAKVTRRLADADSDLGARLVTEAVAPLSRDEKDDALAQGVCVAEAMIRRGWVDATTCAIQGTLRAAVRDLKGPVREVNAEMRG